MDYLKITGGKKLGGSVRVSGAKNAALPAIAATILSKKRVKITNYPDVVDIQTLARLLGKLGAEYCFEDGAIYVDTNGIDNTKATYDIVRKMRASILVLGPLLARFGECKVSLPGGCAIGARPVDLHIKAMEQMGANIEIEGGYIVAKCEGGLHGAQIVFDKITVTGTENVLMAAALAKGKTTILNAAKEPEVVQLCDILKAGGVNISGAGSDKIEIEGSGGELLDFESIEIIPDRIEAGTYLCAGAITNSAITLTNIDALYLESILDKLRSMGYGIETKEREIRLQPAETIKPVAIITAEYPGFPTDMQAQFVALATQAEGSSVIEERLFENRFLHVSELHRLGASIHLRGNTATINGKVQLRGADVMATDLRASSALVLAALVAEGESCIHRIYHLDRGYENIEEKLRMLGADVLRLQE